jgi:hypothetical protein
MIAQPPYVTIRRFLKTVALRSPSRERLLRVYVTMITTHFVYVLNPAEHQKRFRGHDFEDAGAGAEGMVMGPNT